MRLLQCALQTRKSQSFSFRRNAEKELSQQNMDRITALAEIAISHSIPILTPTCQTSQFLLRLLLASSHPSLYIFLYAPTLSSNNPSPPNYSPSYSRCHLARTWQS